MTVIKLRREETAAVHLDAMRALAALSVLLMHFRHLYFVSYKDAKPNIALHFLYVATALGHQAVVIFFVLSGFFISAAVLQRWSAKTWCWRDYLISRSTRLYVVLIPALLLCVVFDQLGMHFTPGRQLYFESLNKFGLMNVASQSSFPVWLGNLFFLQGIAVPTFGSDSPLWSLNYEWWYYILFPAGVVALKVPGYRRLLAVVAAAVVAILVGPQILRYLSIWMMGVAVHWLASQRSLANVFSRRWVLPVALATLGVSLVSAELEWIQSIFWCDFLVGVAFSLLLCAVLQRRQPMPVSAYRKLANHFAANSYTLYLVHLPFLFFVKALLVGDHLWQPDARHLVYALFGIALTLMYAHILANWTETRTDLIRQKVSGWWRPVVSREHRTPPPRIGLIRTSRQFVVESSHLESFKAVKPNAAPYIYRASSNLN